MLKALEFRTTPSAQPIMDAIETIREMNASGQRKVPGDAPTAFVPPRWKQHVIGTDGTIHRAYYEMAALTELRNAVRAGNIIVDPEIRTIWEAFKC